MSNFRFLAKNWKELARMGELAEQYLYTDTNTCFIKMGMLAEHIVKYMLAYDGIAEPERDNTHAGRIHVLRRNDLLPREIDNILYVLQKITLCLLMTWRPGLCRLMAIMRMSLRDLLCLKI